MSAPSLTSQLDFYSSLVRTTTWGHVLSNPKMFQKACLWSIIIGLSFHSLGAVNLALRFKVLHEFRGQINFKVPFFCQWTYWLLWILLQWAVVMQISFEILLQFLRYIRSRIDGSYGNSIFSEDLFIYLTWKLELTGMAGRILPSTGSLPKKAIMARDKLIQVWEPRISYGSSQWVHGPKDLGPPLLLSQALSREPEWKCSCHNWYGYPYGIPVLHMED